MRRPLHFGAALGVAAHNVFELAAGIGLIFQPQLGLRGAAALWSSALPAWMLASARGPRRWDRRLAGLSGAALGGVALHYVIWPWELRRGVPVLTNAEGLRGRPLAAYNALLLTWGTVALLALARETDRHDRGVALGSVLATVASGMAPGPANVERHFEWLREQARVEPAWWNRAGVAQVSTAKGGS